MEIYLVTFKNAEKAKIQSVSVQSANVVFAINAARIKILKEKGTNAVSKIDRETDSVLVEKLT